MKVNDWKKRTQNRVKWKEVVQKAKTCKQWSCNAWQKRRRKEEEGVDETNYSIKVDFYLSETYLTPPRPETSKRNHICISQNQIQE
jgi:hypothetical protein